MNQRLQISIPEACSQNWDAMSPVGDGRYCSSCQKQVKDFSAFSNVELQQWFQLHTDEKSCGRFTQAQLAPVTADPRKINPLAYLKSKLFIASLLALPVAIKASTSNMPVKARIELTPMFNTKAAENHLEEHSHPADTTTKLKGTVIDANDKTILSGAIVEIKGTNKRVLTDVKGNFEIDLLSLDVKADPILVVNSIGYETIEQKIDLQSSIPLKITMSEMVVGGICIKRPNIFQRFIGVFRK